MSDQGSLSDSEPGAVGGAGSSGGSGGDGEANSSKFSAQSVSLRAQKKLIGKLANQKAVKIFIDATSARAFDSIYRIVKLHTGSRSRAQKTMKHIVKLNMKVAVLYTHDILSESEKALADQFRDRFNDLATDLVLMQRGRRQLDKEKLAKQFRDCEAIALRMVRRHLSEKSLTSIRTCSDLFTEPRFLQALFDPSSPLAPHMTSLCQDVQELLDRGVV
ncbi:hypothetical protein BOX15_Mlig004618g1 [Macrostomum lignano]|uniref:Tumor necrosis factor alpha-induced protein 8-like protein n=1 Tax=Macrostomum lignano TaxID=282301 RepID=A0A267FNY1_9PLAT|nr:hypothetical protein BOX15_Mlig004618g1 [Macrostomum lignano]